MPVTQDINVDNDTLNDVSFDPISEGFSVPMTIVSFNMKGFFNPATKEFYDPVTGNIFGPSGPGDGAGTYFDPKLRLLYSISTLPEGVELPNPIVTEEDRDLEQLPTLEELGLIEP